MALGTSATARAAARGWVHTLRWGPATKIHYGRHSVQRRWYVYRPLRHGEHRGHDCYRHQRRSRNLYGRSGLHGHTVVTDGPSFSLYVGPGAQQLWMNQTAGGAGSGPGLGVGTATRLP